MYLSYYIVTLNIDLLENIKAKEILAHVHWGLNKIRDGQLYTYFIQTNCTFTADTVLRRRLA